LNAPHALQHHGREEAFRPLKRPESAAASAAQQATTATPTITRHIRQQESTVLHTPTSQQPASPMSTFATHESTTNRDARCGRSRTLRAALDERGQAMVEFALVLVPMLLIVFGIVEFGLAISAQNDETHIANELARYATVNEDPSKTESLQAWGKRQADESEVREHGQVCISFPKGTSNVGDPVEVKVKYTWHPFSFKGKAQSIMPLTHEVSGTAVMRLEATPSAYSAGCA
jgi:hypothetical protein